MFHCFALAIALIVATSAGAQTVQSQSEKEHSHGYAKYAFEYAKVECPTIVDARYANDAEGGHLVECLSADKKTILRYRVTSGGNMFAVPKISLLSTKPAS